MFRTRWILLLPLAVGLAAVVLRASAQEATADATPAKLRAEVAAFFDNLSSGPPAQALQTLAGSGPLASQREALATLAEKATELEPRYGKFRAAESLGSRSIGKDVVVLRYLYKCDRAPVAWHFTYYRDQARAAGADDRWLLIGVKFDTQLDAL